MSSELDLLRQENSKLMSENAVLIAKIVELEQTAKENAELKARVAKLEQTAEENTELKARVAKLEQKQLQTDISSDTRPSNSPISPEDKEVDDLKVKERVSNEIR